MYEQKANMDRRACLMVRVMVMGDGELASMEDREEIRLEW
jgi:hypothetical protein